LSPTWMVIGESLGWCSGGGAITHEARLGKLRWPFAWTGFLSANRQT
jgi:hypothetical protein